MKNQAISYVAFTSLEQVHNHPDISTYAQWKPELFDITGQLTVVIVPKNAIITDPIVLEKMHDCPIQKLIIIAGQNGQATIVFEQPIACDVIVDQNAQLQLFINSSEAIAPQSQMSLHLRQSGSAVALKWLVGLSANQESIIITQQHHYAPHTSSTVVLKSLLAGTAGLLYHGLIDVAPEAHHTNASQQNKNILLSSGAKCQAKPSLQVKNNEVKCAHGSATGPFDNQMLWYMQTRGVPEHHARQLLLAGFIADVTAPMPESERMAFSAELLKKITQGNV